MPYQIISRPFGIAEAPGRRLERNSRSMKKTICKVDYDTEASELIGKKTFGEFGDPAGYEECLYKTEGGKFFLYGIGGAESPYPTETIKRMAPDKAKDWQEAK